MVIAYHVVLNAYGFWLPNDPRGSWSKEVRARHLRPFGPATKVETRRSVAHRQHDVAARRAGQQALTYSPVRFSPRQVQAVAEGFAQAADELEIVIHACAIMPDHVHLVIGRSASTAEYVASFLKRAATRRLAAQGLHPSEGTSLPGARRPSPWADGGWHVFLDSADHVRATIRYVNENPLRQGLVAQDWPFVRPWDS